jgi:hypothetical protein
MITVLPLPMTMCRNRPDPPAIANLQRLDKRSQILLLDGLGRVERETRD